MHALHKIFVFCALAGFALGGEIINGKKTKKNAMQYMASVQSNKGHICGGFLISEDFVLTAAHCGKPTHVVLGTHNLRDYNKKMNYTVEVCKHPDYKGAVSGNDIMLLKLSRKAKLGNKSNIKTIDLPSPKMKLKENKKCRVAGWGWTKTGANKIENDLQDMEVAVIDLKKCKKQWRELRRSVELPDNVICAGGYNTKNGICKYDSGGPLVCDNQAVGVVSFNCQGNCKYPNISNIYTDVSKFIPWINGILKRKKC
ncbi:duodenase-1-like [Cheilinus undulatus]|uniref:duodenase-1-like n=1 Tax=Cheilinus undulatus TaxID=241271 RepID=UPI001BD598D6|nr:duodenase-1-like [Cheilinus undulatus]